MTVKEAIIKAFCEDGWNTFPEEPTSVDVSFINKAGVKDETQLDLYAETNADRIKELTELWASLCEEFETEEDSITEVYAHGYILD